MVGDNLNTGDRRGLVPEVSLGPFLAQPLRLDEQYADVEPALGSRHDQGEFADAGARARAVRVNGHHERGATRHAAAPGRPGEFV